MAIIESGTRSAVPEQTPKKEQTKWRINLMKKYVCTVCGYIAEGTIPSSAPSARLPLPHSSRRPATPTSPSTLWASARLRAFLRRSSMVCAPTSRASAARSACIWQWPVWPSVRLPRDRRGLQALCLRGGRPCFPFRRAAGRGRHRQHQEEPDDACRGRVRRLRRQDGPGQEG